MTHSPKPPEPDPAETGGGAHDWQRTTSGSATALGAAARRAARLKAALKANMARRKAQLRARTGAGDDISR